MRKALKLNLKPEIRTYHMTAFYLAVLEAYGVQCDGMLFHHYLDTIYWKNTVNYRHHTYIRNHYFHKRIFLLGNQSLASRIRRCIDKEQYVSLIVNERYIEKRKAYRRQVDYDHDIMIFGYDDEKDAALVFSYADVHEDGRSLIIQEIPFAVLTQAFETAGKSTRYKNFSFWPDWKKTERGEAVDCVRVRKEIRRYLYPGNRKGGIRVYRLLREYLKDSSLKEQDITTLWLLWERTALLGRCIQATVENNTGLIARHAALVKKMQLVFTYAARAKILARPELMEGLLPQLDDIAVLEQEVLSQYLKVLEEK